MFENSRETEFGISELVDVAKQSSKPLVFWIGAGASSWNKLPRWDELASTLNRDFTKREAEFDSQRSRVLLDSGQYPEFFGLCKSVNATRYNRLIARELQIKNFSPVYERFIRALKRVEPKFIVTTNVEESISQSLAPIQTIGRSDFDRCISLIQEKTSFVAYLHGNLANIESLVFTKDDYEALINNESYIKLLEYIFSSSTVVFFGYGVADDYVLNSINKAEKLRSIFGSGPHFAVLPSRKNINPVIKQIIYSTDLKKDHRASIQVLEELNQKLAYTPKTTNTEKSFKSTHILADVFAPGKWSTSSEVVINNGASVLVGDGFTDDELLSATAIALEDLAVALLCFDETHCSLEHAVKLLSVIGEQLFVEMVKGGVLKFFNWEDQLVLVYPKEDKVGMGDLASATLSQPNGDPITTRALIERRFKAQTGQENAAQKTYDIIEAATLFLKGAEYPSVPHITRGLLMKPSVKKMIGMSEATPVSSVPRWIAFPVLRLAETIRVGITAEELRAASVKLSLGKEELANHVFSSAQGTKWTHDTANYVLKGRLRANLSPILHNPNIIWSILKFRDTSVGIRFRNEILDRVVQDPGGDIITSVNGGLASAVSEDLLEEAKDTFTQLYVAHSQQKLIAPLLWSDGGYKLSSLEKWRQKSGVELKKLNIYQDSFCPCKSGERFKDCCKPIYGMR